MSVTEGITVGILDGEEIVGIVVETTVEIGTSKDGDGLTVVSVVEVGVVKGRTVGMCMFTVGILEVVLKEETIG